MSDQSIIANLDMPTTLPSSDPTVAIEMLFRAGTSFDGFTAQMRRSFGINAHERLAIAALWERGPMTMTELGAWIPLSRAAVTTLVDRLERANLVERRTDSADRRRTVVHLTEGATSRMEPVIQPWMDDALEMLDRFGADGWQTIKAFLRHFMAVNHRHSELLATLSDAQIQALAAPTTDEGRD